MHWFCDQSALKWLKRRERKEKKREKIEWILHPLRTEHWNFQRHFSEALSDEFRRKHISNNWNLSFSFLRKRTPVVRERALSIVTDGFDHSRLGNAPFHPFSLVHSLYWIRFLVLPLTRALLCTCPWLLLVYLCVCLPLFLCPHSFSGVNLIKILFRFARQITARYRLLPLLTSSKPPPPSPPPSPKNKQIHWSLNWYPTSDEIKLKTAGIEPPKLKKFLVTFHFPLFLPFSIGFVVERWRDGRVQRIGRTFHQLQLLVGYSFHRFTPHAPKNSSTSSLCLEPTSSLLFFSFSKY